MIRKTACLAAACAVVLLVTPGAGVRAEGAANAADADLDHLRSAVEDAYNRGDIDRIAHYLDPDVVIIFPDGKVLKGPGAFRGYYATMMTAPGHLVAAYSAKPVFAARAVYGDSGFTYGYANDRYVLTDGTAFGLDSRFTVTTVKNPNGPHETGGWVIRSFHSSSNVFDNPVLAMAVRRTLWRGGAAGLVVGLLVGAALGLFIARTWFRGASA